MSQRADAWHLGAAGTRGMTTVPVAMTRDGALRAGEKSAPHCAFQRATIPKPVKTASALSTRHHGRAEDRPIYDRSTMP